MGPRDGVTTPDSRAHMVGLDIDGTLMVTGQPPSDAVIDSIARATNAGHVIVLATGRSLAGALTAAHQLGLRDGWVVASNGSVVAKLSGGAYHLTEVHEVDAEAVVTLVTRVRPNLRIAAEIVGAGYRVSANFPRHELNGDQVVVLKFAELWAHPTPRLAIYGDQARMLVPALQAGGMTAFATRRDWVDVTPATVSKATALEKLRRDAGIPPERTVAIGDSENDIPMLQWAARGVAMGHASPLVRFAASYATKGVDADGAALVLDSLAVPAAFRSV